MGLDNWGEALGVSPFPFASSRVHGLGTALAGAWVDVDWGTKSPVRSITSLTA
jgi:hypothetical protein